MLLIVAAVIRCDWQQSVNGIKEQYETVGAGYPDFVPIDFDDIILLELQNEMIYRRRIILTVFYGN